MKNFCIKLVKVSEIRVVNSRRRFKKKYEEIIKSVKTLGLKTPILVAPREAVDGLKYDLICGEGRLNIYKNNGDEFIPARIVDCDRQSVLLMGLVENIARRQGNSGALAREVKRLSMEGYSNNEIAQKIGLSPSYVSEILSLLEKGEEQIVHAVIHGHMPLTVGIKISECSDNPEEQRVISEAYNSKEIKPGQIRYIKELLERRKIYGKKRSGKTVGIASSKQNIVTSIVRDINKKKDFIKQAHAYETKLAFVKGAFREFMADEGFVILLRAENITTFPSILTNNG